MIPTRFNRLGLPPFRRVAYLKSTGTQYIDTGVAPDFANGDSVEISFYKALAASSNSCIFGSRQTPALNGFYVLRLAMVACDTDGYVQVGWVNPPDGDYTLEINDEYVISNGTSYIMPKRITCAYSMYLFALNNGGSYFGIYSGVRLYDWKYYRSGTLAQHLVPVLDKSGVPCLFDEVTRTFKYNAGTGSFAYGEIQS